jgi:Group II intron, maturase-specific domain
VSGEWLGPKQLRPTSFYEQEADGLLVKLKEIFRASRSQPVRGVIEKINPILRGWVKYFAIGHSSRCFSFVQNVG